MASEAPRWVVLPSPLLGPASYEPLAAELRAAGAPVTVADLPVEPITPQSVLAAFESVLAAGAELVLAHSNAGYYLPALLERRSLAAIAMDAALPTQEDCEARLAPRAFAEFVESLPVSDGRLPPWPKWWAPSDVAGLFPDDAWLERISREAPRLPPSYFRGRLPVPRGWESGPRAYVAFGETYAEEVAFAQASGWLVRREDGHHLQYLSTPSPVAHTLSEVAALLTAPRTTPR